jgi:hypothetical protein
MDGFLLILLVVVIGGAIAAIVQAGQQRQRATEEGAEETFSVGRYIVGLPGRTVPADAVLCGVTEDHLIFLINAGDEIGRIPRAGINDVLFEDKTQIAQRLTVTRIATLGIFAFAVPKKTEHKRYCVAIDSVDDRGIRQNTVFEFAGLGAQQLAAEAADALRRAIPPRFAPPLPPSLVPSGDMKCPFCAEIIKREAKICRFCRSELAQDAEEAQRKADKLIGVFEEPLPPFVPVEGQCPACGAAVEIKATECPECSLVLAAEGSAPGNGGKFPALGHPEADPLGPPTFGDGRRRRR